MLKLGTNSIDKIYLGATEIGKAYLGSDLVYQKGEPAVDYSTKYLTLTAFNNSTTTISVKSNNSSPNIPTIWYSTNDGATWVQVSPSTTSTNLATLSNGASILLKGIQSGTSSTGYVTISGTGNFSASGNVMSLIYGDNFIGQKSLAGKDYAFLSLFRNSKIVDVNNMVLPAITLALGCYKDMFRQCGLLTVAPNLPATTLANNCYQLMFYDCTSLTTAPELPATTLANYCYQYMFSGCRSLTTAPELPATTLANNCYQLMFYGCTSLTTAPELPATTLARGCYQYMFYSCTKLNYIKAMFTTTPSSSYTRNWVQGVAATGTFVKNSAATWNVTGTNGVPSGWTVQTASV